MNEAYYTTCIALFFAAAPLLIGVRLAKPKRMPWWLLSILAALLGWVFSNLAVFFYYEHLDDLLAQAGGINGAPEELIDEWQSDGAKRVFVLLFGWLYGLIYLVPWLFVYCVYRMVQRAAAYRRRSTAQHRLETDLRTRSQSSRAAASQPSR